MKYCEDDVLNEALEYIRSTYNQHYVGKNEIQTIDVWHSLDMAEQLCQGTAIKYLMRFGKKAGKNRKDLLKAIHYIVLMMFFAFKEEEQNIMGVKNEARTGT